MLLYIGYLCCRENVHLIIVLRLISITIKVCLYNPCNYDMIKLFTIAQ